MKRSELAKGMRVAIADVRDWGEYGVSEAWVLDVDTTYVYFARFKTGAPRTFDDPRNPGLTLIARDLRPAYKGERGKIAVLGLNPVLGARVELVAPSSIVGTFEEASAAVEKAAAQRKADRKAREASYQSNADAAARLEADHPALREATFFPHRGEVVMSLETLRRLLADEETGA